MNTTPVFNERSLRQLFGQRYQSAILTTMLDQLFPQPDKYLSRPLPLDADERKARSVVQLGTVSLADGRSVAFFEVEVADTINIQRNRQGLRDIAARYIDQSIIHAALVVYHAPQQADYRLSLIAKTAEFDDKGNFITTQTVPKRYTYVLGPNEPGTTAARQFLSLMARPDALRLSDLIEAFSVEKLNKEFFKRYKEHYERFWVYIAERDDYASLLLDPEEDKTLVQRQKPIRDFAKKLLGRLVFLQFLQKKGWMGVKTDSTDWKDGDTCFVRNLYESAPDQNRFYSERLTKLFFETLNTDHPQRPNYLFSVTGTKVPYLNGGLFDNEASQTNHFNFPAEYFGQLFDTFDQFNFTIDENSPDEQEVGIDPEMLGHIFENLLEENRDKGTFYTPKEIVHYMCQESLIQYLRTHLPECADDQAPTTRVLEAFIRQGEVGDRTARQNFIVQNAPRLEKLLDAVKICDPAIGSGAFPMGLLQEIFRAKLALDLTLDRAEAKKHIIQNSIYGVDLEKGAVDIARLRFWLALVVDEDVPQPLPNLDYKIMQGNSLLESFEGIDLHFEPQHYEVKLVKQVDLFGNVVDPQISIFDFLSSKDHTSEFNLTELEEKFFRTNDSVEKARIRAKITQFEHEFILHQIQEQCAELETKISTKRDQARTQRDLKNLAAYEAELAEKKLARERLKTITINEKPYFLWHLYFKDVFDQGGFDIVIGNPPYVQLSKMRADAKALSEEGYATFEKAGDLYCLFYERGVELLKSGGILSYITSNSWLQTQYGESLRRYFLAQSDPLTLLNFVDTQLFETAIVETNILLTQKGNYQNRLRVAVVDAAYAKGSSLAAFVDETGYRQTDLPAQGWSIGNAWESALKMQMEGVGKNLSEWPNRIDYGIKTGLNEAFVINEATKNQLLAADPQNAKIIKPTLRGRDLSRYSYEFNNQWIICTFPSKHIDIESYPAIKKYFIDFGKTRLEQSGNPGSRKRTGNQWFETQDQIAYWPFLEKPKIIWGELADKAKFTYDEEGHYLNNTIFMMTGESLKYLLAVLNSKAAQWYFEEISTTSGMGTNRWLKYKIEQLPVPVPSPEQEQHLETLVTEILARKKAGQATQPLENEVDARVMALYDFTETDVQNVLDSSADLSAADRIQIITEYKGILESGQKLVKREPVVSFEIDLNKNMKDWGANHPIYSITDATDILLHSGLPVNQEKVRRWFRGLSKENYEGIHGDDGNIPLQISFYGLIELVVVGTLYDSGMLFKKIMIARKDLASITGKIYPFATNNVKDYLKLAGSSLIFDHPDGLVTLGTFGQFNIDLIRQFFSELVFDTSGIVTQILPAKGGKRIVIDPRLGNGVPITKHREVPVSMIARYFDSDEPEDSALLIQEEFGLAREDVLAAMNYHNN